MVLAFFPVLDYLGGGPNDQEDRWAFIIYGSLHLYILQPLSVICSIACLVPQIPLLRSYMDSGVIGIMGLAIQMVVFAINAILWPSRIHINWDSCSRNSQGGLSLIFCWCFCVGIVPLSTGIFAIVQAVLLVISTRKQGTRSNRETERLLST